MTLQSSLARYQPQSPMEAEELKKMFKMAAMEKNLLVVDLTKVTDINFRVKLMEYAEKEYQVILCFKS